MSTSIEWTDATWNPVIGCSRVSEGCRNCYAEVMAGRLARMGQKDYDGLTTGTGRKTKWTGVVCLLPEKLGLPLRWRKPRRIFVNSMSDLFHDGFTFEQIATVWAVMAASPQHTFQVLTKRPERAVAFFSEPVRSFHLVQETIAAEAASQRRPDGRPAVVWDARGSNAHLYMKGRHTPDLDLRRPWRWPLPNVWLGVSVENQATADERIPLLLRCPNVVPWISAEPLLGPLDVRRYFGRRCLEHGVTPGILADGLCGICGAEQVPGLEWVVVGGESGPGARPMHPDWARGLRDSCQVFGVPFLFKQWGAWGDFTGREPQTGERHVMVILPSGALVGGGFGREGSLTEEAQRPDAAWMVQVGKSAAGRLLDGRTWDEYPKEAGR